jgi:hypothetical protein
VTLSFILDLPKSFNQTSDVCFAFAAGSNLTCLTREFVVDASGWTKFSVGQIEGTFAVIFNPDMTLKPAGVVDEPVDPTPIDEPDPVDDDNKNPDPEPEPPTPDPPVIEVCDSIWCKYKWWIVGGTGGLLLLIILTVAICKCCCKRDE